MNLKILLVLTVLLFSAILLFGSVTFDTTKQLSAQSQVQILRDLFKGSVIRAKEMSTVTPPVFKNFDSELPNNAYLYIENPNEIPQLIKSGESGLDINSIYAELNGNAGMIEMNDHAYLWFRENLNKDGLSVIGVYAIDQQNISFFESMTSTLFVTMLIVLWGSVWASQYIGNLIIKVEAQTNILNTKNNELNHSSIQTD